METNENNKYLSLHTFNLLSSLLSILNKNDEENADLIIAKYLLNNFDNIKNISIYQIADDCFVSRSSVQRFIKNIGYDSYTQLKSSLDNIIKHEKSFIEYTNHADYNSYLPSLIKQMTTDIANTTKMAGFYKFCDLFLKAKNIILVVAEDSSYCCKAFQQQLLSIGIIVRIVTNAANNYKMLESLNENDLLVVCSITGNFALAINKEIKDLKVKKCLITLNRAAIFENSFSFIYYISTKQQINSNEIQSYRSVYNSYGLLLFFDLVYHECFINNQK